MSLLCLGYFNCVKWQVWVNVTLTALHNLRQRAKRVFLPRSGFVSARLLVRGARDGA